MGALFQQHDRGLLCKKKCLVEYPEARLHRTGMCLVRPNVKYIENNCLIDSGHRCPNRGHARHTATTTRRRALLNAASNAVDAAVTAPPPPRGCCLGGRRRSHEFCGCSVLVPTAFDVHR